MIIQIEDGVITISEVNQACELVLENEQGANVYQVKIDDEGLPIAEFKGARPKK